MFDPVTVTAVAVGVSALTAGIGAIGAIKQGQDQKKVAEYNAKVSEQDAIAARNKAGYDEGIHRERVKRLLSKQRSIIGASGVDMAGSPLLATLDTIEKGELDALAIRQGGEVAAGKHLSSAARSRFQGKSASTASKFRAGSTLLSGAARTFKTYKGF